MSVAGPPVWLVEVTMMVAPLEADVAVVAMMVVPAHVTVTMPFAAMTEAVATVVVMVARTAAVMLRRGRHRGQHERGDDQACKTRLHWDDLSTFGKPSSDEPALNGH